MLARLYALSAMFSLLALIPPAAARAQWDLSAGKISGTGTVTIKRRPDILRMQVQLAAHGKDVKDALTKIKARRDAAKVKLVELGANKDSIDLGEPRANQEDNSRQRQMEMMVRERMRQQGRKAPKKEETKPVSLSLQIKAEWPLKEEDAEQAFIAAYEIQQKVTSELAKLSASEEASAEEEEMAEEMGQMSNFDDGRPKPGEPSFVFAARIPKEELEKSLTTAFAQAKEEAQQLSRIVGSKLGSLERLTTQESLVEMDNQMNYGGFRGNSFLYQALMQRQQNPLQGREGPREAIGIDPGQVVLTVAVVASFGLDD